MSHNFWAPGNMSPLAPLPNFTYNLMYWRAAVNGCPRESAGVSVPPVCSVNLHNNRKNWKLAKHIYCRKKDADLCDCLSEPNIGLNSYKSFLYWPSMAFSEMLHRISMVFQETGSTYLRGLYHLAGMYFWFWSFWQENNSTGLFHLAICRLWQEPQIKYKIFYICRPLMTVLANIVNTWMQKVKYCLKCMWKYFTY